MTKPRSYMEGVVRDEVIGGEIKIDTHSDRRGPG